MRESDGNVLVSARPLVLVASVCQSCSKTIAVTYKAAGILAPNRKAQDFLPKHFSDAYTGFLDMQNGVSLGREVELTPYQDMLGDALRASIAMLLGGFGGPGTRALRSAACGRLRRQSSYHRRSVKRTFE